MYGNLEHSSEGALDRGFWALSSEQMLQFFIYTCYPIDIPYSGDICLVVISSSSATDHHHMTKLVEVECTGYPDQTALHFISIWQHSYARYTFEHAVPPPTD